MGWCSFKREIVLRGSGPPRPTSDAAAQANSIISIRPSFHFFPSHSSCHPIHFSRLMEGAISLLGAMRLLAISFLRRGEKQRASHIKPEAAPSEASNPNQRKTHHARG